MNKYILLILTFFMLISCSSQQQFIQTQKKPSGSFSRAKIAQKTSKSVKKPIYKSKSVTVSKSESASKVVSDTVKPQETEVIVSTSKTKVTIATINEYVQEYKDVAMNNMRSNGIPASIILAQAILESGAGNGDLARDANNHFGIKCHKDWTGESVRHDDDAAQECFRKYPKAADSFQDHATFLSSRGRYSALFKLSKSDYRSWARGLRSAGYATDPRYPEKLITYIQKYNLYKYDNLVLGIEETIDNEPQPIENKAIFPVVTDNGNTHEVQKGDTFFSISKKYNITVDELKQKNNMIANTLSIGQILKIN